MSLSCFPKQVVWRYGTLEDDLIKGFENQSVDGCNLLLGNSSTLENNHLDVFRLLHNKNLNSKKVICPLSYGDEYYREVIICEGVKLFNNNFKPLVSFMPIDNYIKTIRSCGFVIMNHIRQQGFGNIIIMLYLGAKIFLREENPIYKFLKEEGAIVFTIQALEFDNTLLEERLDLKEMLINKDITRTLFTKEVVNKKTKIILDEVFNL